MFMGSLEIKVELTAKEFTLNVQFKFYVLGPNLPNFS